MDFSKKYKRNQKFINRDDVRRCKILGLSEPYKHNLKYFDNVTLKQLNLLLNENFIEPFRSVADCAVAMTYKAFLEEYPESTIHGYITHPDRKDYGVYILGMHYKGKVSDKMRDDFDDTFGNAEEVINKSTELYCCYD